MYRPENKVSLVLLTNQFEVPALCHHRPVSPALAGGVVFQMDQATSAPAALFYGRSENTVRLSDLVRPSAAYLLVAIVEEEEVENPENFE